MTLAPGTRLGPYEIESPLGAGGMGDVYRAKDTRLDREVALKVLPEEFFEDKERRERFEREAKALAALNHPNIAAVYSFEEVSGRHLLVHELLEGGTLRLALSDGALPVRRALEIGEKIAQGLAAAHEKGIVHRDLKPENVFLTSDGNVKLLDFGLARLEAAASGPEDTKSPTLVKLTDPGVVFGTVAYMSPEQARGGAVDFRTDQFSFGVVLFEMLAGERPFDRPSQAETMAAIIREEPAPLGTKAPTVPAPARWIVERCLSKEPSERYASTRDLARDLASCRQHLSEAISAPAAAIPAKGAWKARTALVLLLAAVAALAVLAGHLVLRSKGAGDEAGARPRHFRRLTSLPGAENWPALSPDGETLAYVKEVTPGKADIFVQRIGGQAALNLTKDHLGNFTQPAFSPDGSRIAFRSNRDGGGLFIMGVMGESVRRLTDFGFLPAWFPDGRKIAFSSTSFSRPYIGGGGKGALWTVNVGTGEKKLLHEGSAVEPSVSPHGLRIAYWSVVGAGSHRDIFTIPADGLASGESAVPAVQGPGSNWSPFWSPDGRQLYFGSDRDGTLNLWRIPIDEQSGRPLGAPVPVPVPAWHAGPFSASADGRRIAFVSVEDEFAIEAIPLDSSSGAAAGEPRSVLKTNLHLLHVSVSPRGDALAFSTWGLEEDLWIVRSDGTGLRKVTDDRYRNRFPFFSPDGKRLAFHSDRDGTWNIWTIGVDGSGLTQITADRTTGFSLSAQFSPDGTKLSVASNTEGPRIVPSDFRPGSPLPEPLPLPGDGFMFRPFSWFPDGRRLAGVVWKPGAPGSGIMTLDIASQKYERLTESGTFPALTADGRRLYYLDEGKVWLIDPAMKKPRLIFEGTADRPVIHQTVAPDGRTLYVIRQSAQSDIWLLDSR